jgi:hypothetical protein
MALLGTWILLGSLAGGYVLFGLRLINPVLGVMFVSKERGAET